MRITGHRPSDARQPELRDARTRRVGSYADGLARHPDAPWERRVGSFADGYERLRRPARARR